MKLEAVAFRLWLEKEISLKELDEIIANLAEARKSGSNI